MDRESLLAIFLFYRTVFREPERTLVPQGEECGEVDESGNVRFGAFNFWDGGVASEVWRRAGRGRAVR